MKSRSADEPPSRATPGSQGEAVTAPVAVQKEGKCGRDSFPGFPNPQVAYAAYAEAINARHWCDAINTFAPDARADVAVANFKGLAMLAGADNPKREAYQAHFAAFCTERGLSCSAPEAATRLALALMARKPVDDQLAEVRALATERAEDIYTELMASMAAVDADALGRFDVPLKELEVEGARARALAPQLDGRTRPLPFIKTAAGWMLAAR